MPMNRGLRLGLSGRAGSGTPVLGPTNTVAPVVSGTPEIGQDLTTTNGTWTGNGTITYAYQWLRNGSDIGGATSSTYTLAAGDDLTTVSCRVTATDDDGSRAATSNGLAVTYPEPVNTVAPVIDWVSGSEIGDDLEVTSDGTWTGGSLSYSYQWQRDGVDIPGEDGRTYTTDVVADDGKDITCVVTATNSGGAVSESSNAVAVSAVVPFSPADLFGSGEAGAVYDISDLSTVFSDTSGTTPAVVGGAVARINDKSGNGNHLTQGTGGLQFVLARVPSGGRRNILTETDTMATQSKTVTAAQHTLSFQGTGTVTLSGASTAGPLVGTGPTDIVSLTFTPSAGTLTLTVSGTVELAQLELGASRTAYQSVADASGYDVTESGQADAYFVVVGPGDVLSSGTSEQLVGPWEFWAQLNIVAGAGINQAVFSKSLSTGSASNGQGAEGIFQRSDGAVRNTLAVSRIDVGSAYNGTAFSSFAINTPFVAKAVAGTGPDSLTMTTPLASGSATTPDFSGTPNGSTAFRIGTSNSGATFHFYGGFAIDRNLTAGEATDADAWMDALVNP